MSAGLFAPEELTALEALCRWLPALPGARRGEAARPVAGHGTELLGHDAWRDGLDARRLDLQARLRTGAWWVRTFHDEGEPQTLIAVDVSASMGAKARAACRLAGALAFVHGSGLAPVDLHVLGSGEEPGRAAHGSVHLHAIWARLAGLRPMGSTGLRRAFQELAAVRMAELIYVLSDLADPAPPAEILAPLALLAPHTTIHLVHLRAPDDEIVPEGANRLEAPEVAGERRPAPAASTFREAVHAWHAQVQHAARHAGLGFSALTIAEPFDVIAAVRDITLGSRWR